MKYYAVTDDPNELMHYGIKGMKWGVRRTDAQLGHPKKPRSEAYKRASAKLSYKMRHGIESAKAKWKAYNSPSAKAARSKNRAKAKEERFMKKATEQARLGTLKYGKLTDAQVKKITNRLALEQQARRLGNTEPLSFKKRLKASVKEGIISGAGKGTSAYMEERLRGRGKISAEIAGDKRMKKYNAKSSTLRRERKKEIKEEYFENAYGKLHWPRLTPGGKARFNSKMRKENEKADRISRRSDYYDKAFTTKMANLDAARNGKIQDQVVFPKLPAASQPDTLQPAKPPKKQWKLNRRPSSRRSYTRPST